MAEIEKVRKDLLELARDLVEKGVDSIGLAGQISFFKARFGKCNIAVSPPGIQALGLREGEEVAVCVVRMKRRDG